MKNNKCCKNCKYRKNLSKHSYYCRKNDKFISLNNTCRLYKEEKLEKRLSVKDKVEIMKNIENYIKQCKEMIS